MTIDQLLAAIGLTANDEIPLWDAEESGEPTKKITAQNLAAAVKLLASLLAKSDVKDSLSNTSIDYPLSANQGKVLNDKANTILSDIAAEYDNTATYALGDLCIYQNALYKCITAITTAEAWNATHWTATTLDDMTVKYGDVVNNLVNNDANKVAAQQEAYEINNRFVSYYNSVEHDSGRVYNGKTVYQKRVTIPKADETQVGSVDLTSTGIVTFLGMDGWIECNGLNLRCPLTYYQSSTVAFTVDYVTSSKLLRVVAGGSTSQYYACNAHVIIFYTKD